MKEFVGSQGILVNNSDANSYIERNCFDNTVDIDVSPWTTNTYIYNNVFFGQQSEQAIIAGGLTIVRHNSFLSTDRVALKLQETGSMDATENYWNTADANTIDSMIWDRNDDLGIDNYIPYLPILTEPHPNTPVFFPEYVLTMQAEPSEVNSLTPSVGDHNCAGLVDIGAEQYVNCPNVYEFDHWEGDVLEPNSANTVVLMDSDKIITAVFVVTRRCGDECHPYPPGDLSRDCLVNQRDVNIFKRRVEQMRQTIIDHWLECTRPECD